MDVSVQARTPQSLPPLTTGKKIRGTAKVDPCLPLSTAQDEPTPDGHFTQGTLDKPTELKIRGTAPVENSRSPPQGAPDSATEEPPVSYEDLRHANIKLQVRVHMLEKERQQREIASKAIDDKFMLLEQRMKAFEDKPAQDDKPIQDMASKLATLDEQLHDAQKGLQDKSSKFQELKDRVVWLEKASESEPLRSEGTKAYQDLQHTVASFETWITELETRIKSRDTDVVTRVEALEERSDAPNDHSCDSVLATHKTLMERLEGQIKSIETRVASFETRQGPEDKIAALDGRIDALQQDLKAVREMADDQSVLTGLREEIKKRPTIESVSEQMNKVEDLAQGRIVSYGKEVLKHAKESCKNAQIAAVDHLSARIENLEKSVDKAKTDTHFNQQFPQQAEIPGSTSEILGKIVELSETVNGILTTEARLAVPAGLDDLVDRVTKIERILRRLRDAY